MTDQKLTDELEKALRDEAYDGGMGALSPEEFTDYVRGLAVAAAKVVAEALTPTDDELRDAVDHIEGSVEFQDAINPEALRVVINAALRRSASTDRPICSACGVPFHLIQHDEGCDVGEPQDEPSDAQVQAAFDVIRKHRGGTGLMAVVRAALRAGSSVTEQGEGSHE